MRTRCQRRSLAENPYTRTEESAVFAFTRTAREYLEAFFAGCGPGTCMRFRVGDAWCHEWALPGLDCQRECDTLMVVDGLPVVERDPRPDLNILLDYPSPFGPDKLRVLPGLGNVTLTPAARAAAHRLLAESGDPHACLRLDVRKGSGGVVRVYGMDVGKEERCYRAFECEGLKVVFHHLLDGEFGPHVIDWSEEKGRLVAREA